MTARPLGPRTPGSTWGMHRLVGKRALVIAGAQGIGFAISRQLLEAGCDVFVHYRTSIDGGPLPGVGGIAFGPSMRPCPR